MKDSLGDRMKSYEDAFRSHLPPHFPIIIRIDGKAFHSLTKKSDKPFDADIEQLMDVTALALCDQVQTVQLAYVQSDEISLLLHPYKKLTSQPWFDNNLQKIVSISAATATAAFNNALAPWLHKEYTTTNEKWLAQKIKDKFETKLPALFDSRAFILPECEVVNYFIWRQQDAIRNSISMLAQSLFSHKDLHKKTSKDKLEMCAQKGKDWNDLPGYQQRGRCVRKMLNTTDGTIYRPRWSIDNEIPVFTQDREYIQQYVGHKNEE